MNVNLRNGLGQTLLFKAARGARLLIIKYLVEKCKADVTLIDKLGRNIFCYSAQKGDLKVPKYLLDEQKLEISLNNSLVIHDAIAQSYKVRPSKRAHFMKYFVEGKGMNVNGRDKGGKTPVHIAAREGTLNTVKFLVHHGGDIRLTTLKGQTPLHLAASEGKLSIVDYLVQLEADIQLKDSQGKTPLHLAAKEGKLCVVNYLVRRGANICSRDSNGMIPLQLASNKNVIKYLEKINNKRSSFNSTTSDFNTSTREMGDTNNRITIKGPSPMNQ